jgi:hypothetical protein
LSCQCTATYSLSKYEIHQTNIEDRSGHTAQVHNNDLIAAESLTIVFSVFVATLFGADFFFLLFWPARIYPRWYNTTKLLLAVVITAGVGAAAVMSAIVVGARSEHITGVPAEQIQEYVEFFDRPPLVYRTWTVNVVYVVLIWVGFVFTLFSTFLMFKAVAHDTAVKVVQSPPLVSDPVVLLDLPPPEKLLV